MQRLNKKRALSLPWSRRSLNPDPALLRAIRALPLAVWEQGGALPWRHDVLLHNEPITTGKTPAGCPPCHARGKGRK